MDAPVPQGRYVAAKRRGDLIFTAGMTPRRGGTLICIGPVRATDDISVHREAVVLACLNALSAARGRLADGERIDEILSMTVYVAAEAGFEAHARLADFASDCLFEEFGEAGICARAAVGVASLPGGAPVEISIVAGVARASGA